MLVSVGQAKAKEAVAEAAAWYVDYYRLWWRCRKCFMGGRFKDMWPWADYAHTNAACLKDSYFLQIRLSTHLLKQCHLWLSNCGLTKKVLWLEGHHESSFWWWSFRKIIFFIREGHRTCYSCHSRNTKEGNWRGWPSWWKWGCDEWQKTMTIKMWERDYDLYSTQNITGENWWRRVMQWYDRCLIKISCGKLWLEAEMHAM